MSDDKTQTSGQERTRININEAYELRNWAQKLGVSNKQLIDAVKSVGDNAADVEAHLESYR